MVGDPDDCASVKSGVSTHLSVPEEFERFSVAQPSAWRQKAATVGPGMRMRMGLDIRGLTVTRRSRMPDDDSGDGPSSGTAFRGRPVVGDPDSASVRSGVSTHPDLPFFCPPPE